VKLVLLFGTSAVGKMTVGQELAKITELKLFHNHMTIEPVIEIFGTLNRTAVNRLREVIFEEFARSDNYGLIFTYVWALDQPEEWAYVEKIKAIFEGADIYYVELVADQKVRLERNRTENRLKHKPSKRDVEMSQWRLIHDDEKYRCESHDGEITFPNYLRIDNTNLPPEEAARIIKETFGL